MDPEKSLDKTESLIAALLLDSHKSHGVVFNKRDLTNTLQQVKIRLRAEGIGLLTKTLPRLGKALDKGLAGDHTAFVDCQPFETLEVTTWEAGNDEVPSQEDISKFRDKHSIWVNRYKMMCVKHHYVGLYTGATKIEPTVLPRFLGEYFVRVFGPDGFVLPSPCARSIKQLRQILYCFYKYELPYSHEQEQNVIQKFKRTEEDICAHSKVIDQIGHYLASNPTARRTGLTPNSPVTRNREGVPRIARFLGLDASLPAVAREAKLLLWELFETLDPVNITPRHGPGAVATKQELWEKFQWTNVADCITDVYPFDAYFCASPGHVCDTYSSFSRVGNVALPARVILVPKDSRGPRLISAEPVDFQWVQQGLSKAIVEHVESHHLTRWNVHFTDQTPNRCGALLGSSTGRYATLDLAEASDRVSLALVRLLFPSGLLPYLEACRSSCTVLPNGEELPLQKFAPMGSALCFPVLALTCWSILTVGAPDAETREGLLVYGDDVIVPTAFAARAIELLESFGLLVNRDKSCTSGLFRESCGMDAFNGKDVTPVRLRTVWSESPCPSVYTSWISYANRFWDRQYYSTYDLIVGWLHSVYGCIPGDDMNLSCPSLRFVPNDKQRFKRRWNKSLQRLEYFVPDVASRPVEHAKDGWSMLLRFFTEGNRDAQNIRNASRRSREWNPVFEQGEPFSAGLYTRRDSSMLLKRWR